MKSYSRSSLGLVGFNGLYAALGLVQAMAVAAVYGAGREYDLYLVAQTLPELWIYLLAGLLQSGFLPGYLRLDAAQGPGAGWRLRWASVGLVMAASTGLLAASALAAPWLVRLLAPGFPAEALAPCAGLFRLLLITAWISSLIRLLTNFHHAERSFVLPAATQSISPVLVSLLVLGWGRSWGIEALWLGLSLGALGQGIALWPRIWRAGRSEAGLKFWHPSLGPILALSWPLILGVLANRINFAVDRAVASTLNWGDISALRYGFLILTTASLVFSFPFSQTLFPRLCRLAEAGRIKEMAAYLSGLGQFYVILLLPGAGLIALFAFEAVQVLFFRGAFSAQSVQATAWALICYSPCLVVLPLVQLLGGVYASLQRTRALSAAAGAAVILNLIADLILAPLLGLAGIALATSLIQAAWAVILYLWLIRLEPEVRDRASLALAGRCLSLTVLIGGGVGLVEGLLRPGLAAKIVLAGAGLLAYALAAGLPHRARIAELWRMFKETET